MVLLATGCGAASTAGNFPIVVAHPKVQSTGIPNVKAGTAALLPPRLVVFNTTGTTNCVWWPTRLTVLDADSIRVEMRVNGLVARCGSGGVPFPISLKVPGIDVGRSLTVLLAYKVRLPGEQHARQWENTVVAPPLSG